MSNVFDHKPDCQQNKLIAPLSNGEKRSFAPPCTNYLSYKSAAV
jgi:hypothetical protein